MSSINKFYVSGLRREEFLPLAKSESPAFHKLEKDKKEALSLKEKQEQNQDKSLRKASQLYEKHFLRELVKSMRKTVPESSLTKSSMGEKIYKQQLDAEYVEKWGDAGGLGLADIIYTHIKDQFKEER